MAALLIDLYLQIVDEQLILISFFHALIQFFNYLNLWLLLLFWLFDVEAIYNL